MSERMKLTFALLIAAMALGGCVPTPDDFPPLATASQAVSSTG